jgi:NAD+ synthase
MNLCAEWLAVNLESEAQRIEQFIRSAVVAVLKKKGVVVAVSGGIDSSTTAALCVRALGKDRVFALLMPEHDSSSDSLHYGRMLVEHLGIHSEVIDISPILEAMGCYKHRDEAIRDLFPEYTQGYKNKIVLKRSESGSTRFHFFSIVIQSPDGIEQSCRLPLKNYLQIVAATNMKQRARKSLEYFHADRMNFAVAGTPNFLEYDQGFFVKLGDGSADIKPIAHLYKTQVYAMAHHLGLPPELCERQPTTDTYSLEQSQEEFYFEVPLHKLDLMLYGMSQGLSGRAIAAAVGMPADEVENYLEGIRQKKASTAALHMRPLTLVETIAPGHKN